MDFFGVVRGRHSIRAYRPDSIGQGRLDQILDAAKRAPSAGNLQSYEIYVVCDEHRKAALARAAGDQEFVSHPPFVLAFCAHADRAADRYGRQGKDLYAVQDATIACTFAMLAAPPRAVHRLGRGPGRALPGGNAPPWPRGRGACGTFKTQPARTCSHSRSLGESL